MVALLSGFVIASFVIVMAGAAFLTVRQYGHLVGPSWRMEEPIIRSRVVHIRQYRQPVLRGFNTPSPRRMPATLLAA